MANREQVHARISDLLETLTINNNRLSLHAEELSELDVQVLRKQCIDLYEQINNLIGSNTEDTLQKIEVAEPKAEEPLIHVQEEPKEQLEQAPLPAAKEESKIIEKPIKPNDKENMSIHMKHQDEAEMVSLFEKFNSKPINTISEAITISKRFEFQNNFFDGDAANYKEFIKKIDDAGDREAAFLIYHDYKKRLAWDNEELKDELKSLLYRKYLT